MANMESNFEQLLAAVRRLPVEPRVKVWEMLDAEFDRNEIRRRARQASEAIWADNAGINEDEATADIDRALQEVRAQKTAPRS
jgi:hypothetical protein